MVVNFPHQCPRTLYVVREYLKIETGSGDFVVSRKVHWERSGGFCDRDGRDRGFLRGFLRVDSILSIVLGRHSVTVTDIHKHRNRHLSTGDCSGVSELQDAQADFLWCL
jgi:hypothetical protein